MAMQKWGGVGLNSYITNRAAQIASKFLDQDGKFELGFTCQHHTKQSSVASLKNKVVRIR